MDTPVCPICKNSEILEHPGRIECVNCGHEWVLGRPGLNMDDGSPPDPGPSKKKGRGNSGR